MIGMRMGAVFMAKKKGYRLTGQGPSEHEELKKMSSYDSHTAITDYDIKENTKQKIVFTKYPFLEWGMAAAFFAAFTFSELVIHEANDELGNHTLFHNWT